MTEDTNNITLHAFDMKIDEDFTNIRLYEYLVESNKKIEIAEQRNDTERQFYVIKTRNTLRKDEQYVVHLKFTGNLNDDLEGFYRSSYMVGNQKR